VKLGRCVRYAGPDLEAFVLAALPISTSDPGAAPAGRTPIRVEALFEKTACALGRAQAARPPRPRNRAKRLARRHGVSQTGAASGTLLHNQSSERAGDAAGRLIAQQQMLGVVSARRRL